VDCEPPIAMVIKRFCSFISDYKVNVPVLDSRARKKRRDGLQRNEVDHDVPVVRVITEMAIRLGKAGSGTQV
jgi:hypothetical protein